MTQSPNNSLEEQLSEDATLEHVIPLSKGGTWDAHNIMLAHDWCNWKKKDEKTI